MRGVDVWQNRGGIVLVTIAVRLVIGMMVGMRM